MNVPIFLAQTPTLAPSVTPTATPSASITSNLSPTAATPITLSPQAIPWGVAAVAIALAVIFLSRAQYHKSQAAASQGASPDSAGDKDSFFRNEIARILLNASIWGLVILGGLIILLSFTNADSSGKAKVVFDSLLPVFGTWVGTLLAFYFGKANFESGARVAQGAADGDKLRSIPVKDKMIGPGKITTLPPDLQGKQDSEIPLKTVSEHLKNVKLDRLPLFAGNKGSGVAEKVVHLSKIEKYLADKILVPSKSGAPAAPTVSAAPAAPADAPATPAVPAAAAATPAAQSAPAAEPLITELTLANLFKDVQPDSTFKNFTFVKESATLADAKAAMDAMTKTPGVEGNCYDVFVTATGDCKEPVIGWITNDIINENAKV
jgi:hypothetical protein